MSFGNLFIVAIICLLGAIYFLYEFYKVLILKFNCSYEVEATIHDLNMITDNSGAKKYIPTYYFFYNGQSYFVEGSTKVLRGHDTVETQKGTKVKIKTNEYDPTQIYDNLDTAYAFYILMLILLSGMLAGVITIAICIK